MQVELNSILTDIGEARQHTNHLVDSSKTYICVLGPTGASKSTFISYSLDFSSMKVEKKGINYQITHINNSSLPVIGNSLESETVTPEVFSKQGFNYIDFPGIFDTKGPRQEIINAYSSTLALKRFGSYKFLIMIEVSSIYEKKGGRLPQMISRLEEMFGNQFLEVGKSSCLVVSKNSENDHTEEQIINQIKQILDKNSYLSPDSKRHLFLKSILEGHRVCFFPIPKQITEQKIKDIEQVVSQLPSYKLRNLVKFSPSESAKTYLQQMISVLAQEIKSSFQVLAQNIQNKYQKTYSSVEEAEQSKRMLLSIEQMLSPLPDWKQFSVKTLLQELEIPLNLAVSADSLLKKLKQLLFIYPNSDLTYNVDAVSVVSVISNSKLHAGNEAARIRNQIEIERIRRERERQAEQQRILQEQERQRYQAQLRRERQQRERIERENFEARLRREQEDRERQAREKKQAEYRAHQAWLASQRAHDSSSDNCLIM